MLLMVVEVHETVLILCGRCFLILFFILLQQKAELWWKLPNPTCLLVLGMSMNVSLQ